MSKKNVIGQCDLIRALCELSSMFSDTTFKVLMALTTRMDYRLENTLSVMSLREIADMVAKTDQQILNAIRELEARGLLTKISGKHHKEDARILRSILYHREQFKTRSYNEINAYDLHNLVEFVKLYIELSRKEGKKEALSKMREIREQSLATEKKTKKKPSYIELTRDLRGSDAPIEESDAPNIVESDTTNIGESDAPIIVESDATSSRKTSYIAENELNHTHTPTRATEKEDGYGSDLEGRSIETPPSGGGAIFKQDSGQAIENQAQDNLPSRTKTQTKTKRRELDDELRKFILDDLLAQEKEGKINSANAVMKRLTDEDIELYRQKLDSWKQEQEKQKEATQRAMWKVISFLANHLESEEKMRAMFGDEWQKVLEVKRRKKELKIYQHHAFMKVKAIKVNEIIAKASEQMINVTEYEYTKDYERFFNA